MSETEMPFQPREKLIEKQKYFHSLHRHTYLKGPYDKITSVAIPLALAGASLFMIDAAMGLVLSAAYFQGMDDRLWHGSPVTPTDDNSGTEKVSTFPWSLFTKSPRRWMRVAFTCNVCCQRTTRSINPHAFTDGTVFVQCCGCNVFHKLVDNLNLFHEMKCYVSPGFNYKLPRWDDVVGLKYLKMVDDKADDDPICTFLLL